MTRRYVWAVLLPKTLVARGDGGDARLQRRPVYVRVEMLIWKHRLADGLPGGRKPTIVTSTQNLRVYLYRPAPPFCNPLLNKKPRAH